MAPFAPSSPLAPSRRNSLRQVAGLAALCGLSLLRPSLSERYGGATWPRLVLYAVAMTAAAGAAAMILGWLYRTRPTLRELGLTTDGLGASLRMQAPWMLLCLVAVASVNLWSDRGLGDLSMTWRSTRTALLYPLWAGLQQLLVLGYTHRHLEESGLTSTSCICLSAGFMACLHLPNLPLAILTGLLGLLWTISWTRHRNLVGIAICHGLLGTLADEVLDMDLHVGLHYLERLMLKS